MLLPLPDAGQIFGSGARVFGNQKKSIFLSPRVNFIRHADERNHLSWFRSAQKSRERNASMAKFLFIYRSSPEEYAKMSPEQLQQHNQKWMEWIMEALKQGWMIEPGDALTAEGRVLKAKVVTDGPFVESKEIVGGYSIVEADSLDSAAKLAKGCPGLLLNGSVEVRCLAGFSLKS
jgi:hypothetical protein